jgi:hypothetical protein
MVGAHMRVETRPAAVFGHKDGTEDVLGCLEAADDLPPAGDERVGRRHRRG